MKRKGGKRIDEPGRGAHIQSEASRAGYYSRMASLAAHAVAAVLLFSAPAPAGELVRVRYLEGTIHDDLLLRATDGSVLAEGVLSQAVDGMLVTTRLVLRFKDGSLHDETVVFSQGGRFRLVRDHLVQTGPAFPRSIDMTVDGESGRVRVAHGDGHGGQKQVEASFDLPLDLANGMVPTMLKNIGPDGPRRSLSLIVATPAPRLVRLAIASASPEPIPTGPAGESRAATHYVLKVEIGGVAGWLAPLVGRQPPDSHVWIAAGDPPAYLRSDQPFFVGGPPWRIEVVERAR